MKYLHVELEAVNKTLDEPIIVYEDLKAKVKVKPKTILIELNFDRNLNKQDVEGENQRFNILSNISQVLYEFCESKVYEHFDKLTAENSNTKPQSNSLT